MFDYSETSSTLSTYVGYVCIKGIINTFTGKGTPFWQYCVLNHLGPNIRKYSNIRLKNGFEYSNMDFIFDSNH